MGIAAGLLLPLSLWAIALALGRREIGLYRQTNGWGDDLFVYSKARLYRRMSGVAVLVLLGATLMALELFPVSSGRGIAIYMALILTETAALVVIPLLDLRETARTANSITGREGPDR